MLRLRRKTLGGWTIFALVLATLGALVAPAAIAVHGPAVASPRSVGTPASHLAPVSAPAAPVTLASVPVHAAAHPASGNSSPNITANAAITDTYPGLTDVPFAVDWTIGVTGTSLTDDNVSMSLLITNGANEIANWSQAVVNGTSSYSAMVDYGVLTSENFNGGNLPTTPYTLTVWVTAWNRSNGSVPWANASAAPVAATLAIANVGVLTTNAVPLYVSLPFDLNVTVTTTGNTGATVDAGNVTISVEMRFVSSGCNSVFGLGAPCVSIANNSVPFASSGTYDLSIDSSWFTSNPIYGGQIPLGNYQVITWVTFGNTADPNQAPRSGAAAVYVYPVLDPNAATFLSPQANQNVTAGDVAVSVAYTADYLSAANVTVYEGTSNTVVFVGGVFLAAFAQHSGTALWQGATAGEYRAVLYVTTSSGAAGGATSFSEFFNVTSAGGGTTGGTVYQNTTTWHNTTTPVGNLIGGLSSGAAAALLLVVGLIVGMIVALALGMMVWGGQKPASPQPWSPKGNECSVCHQTFPTDEELKEHQKKAHGM